MRDRPRLRPFIQALPLGSAGETGDGPLFVLRDPFKLVPGRELVLPLAGVALVQLVDGSRDLDELAAEFERRHGARPGREQVQAVVQALRDALLLEGPQVEAALEAFRQAPVRPPACIGSYPGEPAELTRFLEAQWTRPDGPGGGPGGGPIGRARGPIRGIVSPHIDLHRGGHAYAHAWRAVAESCPAELFVIFGTSHTGTAPLEGGGGRPPRFALTAKDFATPLGTVPTDRELLERLQRAYRGPDDLFAGELHHRHEHSIEFQTVWLAHLFLGRRPVRILPILCGGLDDLGGPARRDEGLRAFHGALAEVLAAYRPEQVAFVAGIDLAHVGAQFDAPPLSLPELQAVEEQDRLTMDLTVRARDPDLVHDDIRRDGDPRSICGHAPLVSLLLALDGEPLQGELLHYGRWYDGQSAVSFASAVLSAEGGAGDDAGGTGAQV